MACDRAAPVFRFGFGGRETELELRYRLPATVSRAHGSKEVNP